MTNSSERGTVLTSTSTAVKATPLEPVVDALRRHPDIAAWRDALGDADKRADARVSEHVLGALLAATCAADHGNETSALRTIVLIAAEDADAERIAESVGWYLGSDKSAALIGRGVLYGGGLAPAPARVGSRAHALDVAQRGGVIVASVGAILEKIPANKLRVGVLPIAVGDIVDRDEFIRDLVIRGYERTEQAEERGQFAVRGDIVDVFATTARNPSRIEFFDVEVEHIRAYSSFTQRSLGKLDSLLISPASELPDIRTSYLGEDAGMSDPVLEAARGNGGMVDVLTEFAEHSTLFVWDTTAVKNVLDEHLVELGASHAELDGYVDEETIETELGSAVLLDSMKTDQRFAFEGEPPTFAALGFAEAESELQGLVGRGLRGVVTFPHRGHAQRTSDKIRKLSVAMLDEAPLTEDPGAWFAVSLAATGFVSRQLSIAVVPSGKLFRQRVERDAAGEVAKAMAAFTHLRVGDYIVHEDHGVGRFAGFETKTVAGVTRDYLYVEFAGDDRLYVPHEQIAKVTRYIGADGSAPALSKLGGKRWANLKNRARTAVRELAGELLALYAKRAQAVGRSFPEDDELVERFELSFPYQETPDQLKAIGAVKEDMERPQPMDRLLCGDVGFGKTEVALRAAMKAVTGGTQVMVLVPTTVLAQQHLVSFKERLDGLPVDVDMVSRFRTKQQITKTLERFQAGNLDILIGTHRLLSRDVLPRDLGLVVLDEEQRFGVAQKEMLRQLRLEVDVLAMSATPIPRTLHMSLAGLRDITVIETAPVGRRAIHTHVGEYDEELVRMSIERELERDGQVFYLHNRVETIDEAAMKIRQIVPNARVGVGHGQMGERHLESIMLGFMRRDFDVLVATTIIESGLDIPSANTLIVDRADMLGLSQLYQIRGRVGRSDRSAHAYLFYPSRRELTEEARARLTTLSDFTDLGSGSRIAMRDLELRGAGNLLGAEQSGHVAAIGFELYVDMLAESVAELSGNEQPITRIPTIDARVDAYIPADYVASEAIKIDIHRRIALARSEEELRELELELTDRFGDVPDAVRNLMLLTTLRLLLQDLGADRLTISAGRVSVAPIALSSGDVVKLRAKEPLVAYSASKGEVQAQVPDMSQGLARSRVLLEHVSDVVD